MLALNGRIQEGKPMRRYRVVALIAAFFLAGCGSEIEDEIHRILAEALPELAEPQLLSTCYSFMGLGPVVALFDVPMRGRLDALIFDNEIGENAGWTRHQSLLEFVEQRSVVRGAGLGATILDGKKCLRKLNDNSASILFEERPGSYYSSADERIVVILFDKPQSAGVIFIQAP